MSSDSEIYKHVSRGNSYVTARVYSNRIVQQQTNPLEDKFIL